MNLEHSDYLQTVACDADGLSISSTNTQAILLAQNSWSRPYGFVLVTFTDGCGSSTDRRTFWLVDHPETHGDGNIITATVQEEVVVEDAMQGVDMMWGTYKPGSSSGSLMGRRCWPPQQHIYRISSVRQLYKRRTGDLQKQVVGQFY